jgi:predicted CopG family antitoxin
MGKTITIEDDVYQTLAKLKEGPGDSFSKVLRRHVFVPAKTNAELLAWHESQPPPRVDADILYQVLKGRRRRSGGRK